MSTNTDEQKEDTGACGQKIRSSVASVFYSVLSLILFFMLDREEKKGSFDILHKRPKYLIYQFALISLCLFL